MKGPTVALLGLALAVGCGSNTPTTVDAGVAKPPEQDAQVSPSTILNDTLACADSLTDVYLPNSAFPAMTDADRGSVVRCELDGSLTAAQVQLRAVSAGYVGPTLNSGATLLRIAYRTERLAGQSGVGTAMLYIPQQPRTNPIEAVVAVHGTSGLADACAPSKANVNDVDVDAMVMPLVGQGMAVIAPDYAGLGNGHGETHSGWDIAQDEAHSVLDAARALQAAAKPNALTAEMALVGHSQGGGAVLAAQALRAAYAPDLQIAGVVAFAPGWFDRRDWGWSLSPANLTSATGNAAQYTTAYLVMYFFGHATVYDGVGHALDPFSASVRDQVQAAVDTQCVDTLGTQVASFAPTLGDLFDATFAASVSNCLAGTVCDATGTDWVARMDADHPALDATGAPILLIQGLADTSVTPTATACTFARLQAENVSVQACTDTNSDHMAISGAQAMLALQFIEARLAGNSGTVTCSNGLPTNCANP